LKTFGNAHEERSVTQSNFDVPFSTFSVMLPPLLGDTGLWIGVDKMLAPFRETVKI
jgi:hypothetical protein